MVKVIIFKLGYTADLDLNRVAKFINSSKTIRITVGEPLQNIGSPDLYRIGYSIAHLSRLFPTEEERDSLRFGIISAPLELNYFSHTFDYNNIVISLHLSDEVCERAEVTKEQYVAYTILRQGMWAIYGKAKGTLDKSILFHNDTRGCLFDYCWNKLDIVAGLHCCWIDDICRGNMVEANISYSLIKDIENLLGKIRTPTLLDSFISALKRPFFSFIFGGVVIGALVNILSTVVLNGSNNPHDYYVLGSLLSLALLMITGNYIWMLNKRKSLKDTRH